MYYRDKSYYEDILKKLEILVILQPSLGTLSCLIVWLILMFIVISDHFRCLCIAP